MKKFIIIAVILSTQITRGADIVLADFEGKDYGAWKTTGEAFGSGPAQGTLPRQMRVEGFQGNDDEFLHNFSLE